MHGSHRLRLSVFLLVVCAAAFGAYSAAPSRLRSSLFWDLTAGDPTALAAEFLVQQQLLSGYPDGTFRAANPVNRAELTKIVVGIARRRGLAPECPLAMQGDLFTDVAAADWFAPFVCSAKTGGIIQGYADGSFHPGSAVTFAEAAKMITQTVGYELAPGEPWYQPSVDVLAERNAIPISIASLHAPLRRGELVQVLYRLFAGVTDQPSRTAEDLASGHPAAESEQGMLLQNINAQRVAFSLAPLRSDAQLQRAAQLHAEDMRTRHFFSHVSPEGADAHVRIRASGYLDCNCPFQIGENIVMVASADTALDMWMHSPPHRANLLSSAFTDIGIGHDGDYWVLTFGSRTL